MATYSEPNQRITLAETKIIEIDGHPVDVPVNVIFRLSPDPAIVIEAEVLPNVVLQKERFRVSMLDGTTMETMCSSRDFMTGKGCLIPARQPVDVLDKGMPLKAVQFSVLNFPTFYGSQDVWRDVGATSTLIPHTELEASGWCIEITALPNASDTLREIHLGKRYGFTHDGIITRKDGTTFTPGEVSLILEALRLFLSFARGNYCSLALVEGQDEHGEKSWVRWGSHYVESWKHPQTWICRRFGGDILSGLFPRFLSLFESGDQSRETISRAIDWYLQSNESATHVGIILTAAALERLAFEVLQRTRNEATGLYIEKALKQLGLETTIPQECGELRQLQKWNSGPHAIDDIRNDLVHPKTGLGNISWYVHHETWSLGQWYVEMILLNLLGYQGEYINRLSGWGARGLATQPVPWTAGTEGP